MRIVVGLIAAISLIALSGYAHSAGLAMPAGVVARTEALIPSLRAEFDKVLFDYPTARFRDVHVVWKTGNTSGAGSLCGYVNSKNRMGAYAGWRQFMAFGAPGDIHLVTEGDNLAPVLLPNCDPERAGSVFAPQDLSARLAKK